MTLDCFFFNFRELLSFLYFGLTLNPVMFVDFEDYLLKLMALLAES